MNKFKFNLKNGLLAYKFMLGYKRNKIEYPAIIDHLKKTYGEPVFMEEFRNLDNWMVTDRHEWGSARPGNPFSSGMVTSKFLVKPGQVVSATVNTSNSYAGSWFSFWLYKKDAPGDDNYRRNPCLPGR